MRKCVPFMLFFLIEVVGNIDAQIIRKGEWEKFDLSQYTDKRLYVQKYEDAALNIKGFYKSGADGLTVGRSVKIDSIPKTKDELFRNLYSFLSDDDLCHIEEIDKKVGSIRGTVFIENVSSMYRGTNAAPISVCVMLAFGIGVEDGKIHIEMRGFENRYELAHLISCRLMGTITPEEEERFQKWWKESESHEKEYEIICKRLIVDLRRTEHPDLHKAWKGVWSKLPRTRRLFWSWHSGAAVCAGVILLLGLGLFGLEYFYRLMI